MGKTRSSQPALGPERAVELAPSDRLVDLIHVEVLEGSLGVVVEHLLAVSVNIVVEVEVEAEVGDEYLRRFGSPGMELR